MLQQPSDNPEVIERIVNEYELDDIFKKYRNTEELQGDIWYLLCKKSSALIPDYYEFREQCNDLIKNEPMSKVVKILKLVVNELRFRINLDKLPKCAFRALQIYKLILSYVQWKWDKGLEENIFGKHNNG